MSAATVLDAYLRVSRVGGRQGERYHSPDEQRAAAERAAKIERAELGVVILEENESGGVEGAQRRLEELLQRCERGESSGIIVMNVARFGRTIADNMAMAERLRACGARLVSIDEALDTSKDGSKVPLTIYSMLAEIERDKRTDDWKRTHARVASEGVHVARATIGYRKVDRRLVVDPVARDVAVEAFKMRAAGKSFGEVAKYISTQRLECHHCNGTGRKVDAETGKDAGECKACVGRGVRSNVCSTSARKMLENRVYLGEARAPGGHVTKDAHEAIIEPGLWASAQSPKTKHQRDGSLSSQASLQGLICCAGCGRPLNLYGRGKRRADGTRAAGYGCYASYRQPGSCPAPAFASVAAVDDFVLQRLAEDESTATAGAAEAETAWLTAQGELRQAQEALELFEDPTLIDELGRESWRRGIQRARARVEAAQASLWELKDPGISEDAKVVTIDGKPRIYHVWGEDKDADRRMLARYIERVELRQGSGAMSERVAITWKSGAAPKVVPLRKAA